METLTPRHIAFILDGNRRWAKERGLSKTEGHTAGFKQAEAIIEACVDRGIPYITYYAWSTENHKERDTEERTHIFKIFEDIRNSIETFKKRGVRIHLLGNIKELPFTTRTALEWVANETKHHTTCTVSFAINYGGRDEILRAVKKIVGAHIPENEITEETMSTHLDTSGFPDPELMVRTGKGNMRLSNYLLWQLAYAEFYFPGIYWPDFSPEELDKAIEHWRGVKRNFGK